MNNTQVAHVWAQQGAKQHGRGSNFYFDGPTIYSYGSHFPVASFTDRTDAEGRRVVLFNSERYSPSTAKHQSYARRAVYGLPVRVFQVPEPVIDFDAHGRNVRHYTRTYEQATAKVAKARTRKAEYHERALTAQTECRDYCTVFELDIPEFAQAITAPEVLAAIAKSRRLAAAREKRRLAGVAKEREKARELWRAGESVYAGWGEFPTMLRLSADGARIETSRGAEVPVTVAPRLLSLVAAARASSPITFDLGLQVGDFTLREVRADGALVIGCHVIEYDEIARMADTLAARESQAVAS